MGIPGEHLNGVYSANEFLTRINLMHAYEFPKYDAPIVDFRGKNVAVIGGGNTALDSIRSALRLGAGKAFVLYRRSEAEMPARKEEVKHAQQEGIEFQYEIPLSVAVIVIGTSANPIVQSTTPGLNTNKRNYIQADAATQRTSRKGVFAGGDIVTGSATVILAMGAGRRAAKSINDYLTSGEW